MSPSPHRAPRRPRPTVALLVALVLAVVAGCGVRLETPPPVPPSPGVDEVARQRASADAVALGVLAGAPGTPVDPVADPVGAARAAVAAEAATHLVLLGGLHRADDPASAGDSAATPSPTPSPAPAPAPVPVEAVVAGLTDAAATARTDLAVVTDGGLARLLGSLAASRLLSASRLATAAGLAPPPVPEVVVPDEVPDGVGGSALATLVAAEDAAGYALEVVAAKHTGDLRARAGARAATHRARARAWAEAAGVAGTGLDPRRVAYALPGGLEDPGAASALAAELEATLAADYATLVGRVPPDARAALADAVTEATAHALRWGAPLPALPGLPEHAAR